jgi:hypothetical protein
VCAAKAIETLSSHLEQDHKQAEPNWDFPTLFRPAAFLGTAIRAEGFALTFNPRLR